MADFVGPMQYDEIGPERVESPLAMKIAEYLRKARGNFDMLQMLHPATRVASTAAKAIDKDIKPSEPVLGGLLLGESPEAAERIGYGKPLYTPKANRPGLEQFAPGTLDLAGLGLGAAVPITRAAAPLAVKGLRAAAENAAKPVARGPRALQRGGVDVGSGEPWLDERRARVDAQLAAEPGPPQASLPGIEPLTRAQQTAQDVADLRRREAEMPAPPEEPKYSPEDKVRVRSQGETIARLLRERPRSGPEPTADALRREEQLLSLKLDAPEAAWPNTRGGEGRMGRRQLQQETVDELRALQREGVNQKAQQATRDEIANLRSQDTPIEPLEDALRREGDILKLKRSAGYGSNSAEMRRQMDTVRELRRAAIFKANDMTPDTRPGPIPNWAEQLTELPTTRGIERGGMAPAGQDWWNHQFNVDPDRPVSVGAFLKHVRGVPEAFQYGTEPKGLRSLEDYAEEFGKRGKERISVDWGSNADDYDEPYKIKTEKEHGRGELMRDQYGDYKYSDEPKVHEAGDYPMYDERGEVKKKELFGPPLEDEGPLKVKRRAEYGDIKRDEYGNEKYPLAKSRGGEPYRDERGRQKYIEEENPDYSPPEDNELTLSTPRGELTASNYGEGDEALMGAMGGGKSGALLYQTLLAHASKAGHRIGVSGLTADNQLRILSNSLANYARTGVNPRDVSGTLSGARKHAVYGPEGKKNVFAAGPDIWRAETGEAERRIAEWGGDPNALQFNGKQFLAKGEPITPGDLAQRMEEFAPGFKQKGHKAGPKTAMRAAVYRWLETASPEQAEEAAKNWGKVGGPLFGLGAAGVSAALASKLREDSMQ